MDIDWEHEFYETGKDAGKKLKLIAAKMLRNFELDFEIASSEDEQKLFWKGIKDGLE